MFPSIRSRTSSSSGRFTLVVVLLVVILVVTNVNLNGRIIGFTHASRVFGSDTSLPHHHHHDDSRFHSSPANPNRRRRMEQTPRKKDSNVVDNRKHTWISNDNPCDRQSSHHDAIACWLWNVKVYIPDESFKAGILTVKVKNMICTNFQTQSISSSYHPPTDPTKNNGGTISIEVSGIAATCSGRYHSGLTGGTVTASVQNSNLSFSITITPTIDNKTNIKIASSASVSACKSQLVVPPNMCHFSGFISAKFVNMFSGKIAKHVSDVLSTTTCPQLQPAVSSGLNQMIQKSNRVLLKTVFDGTPSKSDPIFPGTPGTQMLDLTHNIPLLQNTLDFFNKVFLKLLFEKDCGFKILPNSILVHPPQKQITIPIPNYGSIITDVSSIHIAGLNRMRNVSFLNITSHDSMVSSFEINGSVDVTMDLDVQLLHPSSKTIHETLRLHFSVSNAQFFNRFIVMMDKARFEEMTLHGFLLSSTACLQESMRLLNFTDLSATMNITSFQVSSKNTPTETLMGKAFTGVGSIEDDLDALINHVFDLIFMEYNGIISAALYGLIQGPLRHDLNNVLASILKSNSDANGYISGYGDGIIGEDDNGDLFASGTDLCISHTYNNTEAKYIHFENSSVIQTIHSVMNTTIGLNGWNTLLNCFIDDIFAGDAIVDGEVYSVDYYGIKFLVRDMIVKNFDSFYQLDLVNSEIDPYHLFNSIALGQCTGTNNTTFQQCNQPINATFTMDITTPSNIQTLIRTSLSLGNLSIQGGTVLQYNLQELLNLTIFQLTSQYSSCLISPIHLLEFYNLKQSFQYINLDLDVLVMKNGNVSKSANLTLDSDMLVATTNELLGKSVSFLSDLANEVFNLMVYEAPFLCVGETVPIPQIYHDGGSDGWILWNSKLFLWMVGFLMLFGIILIFIRCGKQKHVLHVQTPSLVEIDPQLTTTLLPEDNECTNMAPNRQVSQYSVDCAPSLMFHQVTPKFFQYSVPVIILCTIILFFISDISTGTDVNVVITLPNGSMLQPPPVFQFSIINTVKELYTSGMVILAVLVVLLSGIWPYIKLILMLMAWILPPTTLSTNTRESMLTWLDALGKYSLVDVYILVLVMCAFRIHFTVMDDMTVDLYVTPVSGFYQFCVGTMISLKMGHLIMFLHRKSVAIKEFKMDGKSQEAIREHSFQTQKKQRVLLSNPFQVLFILSFIASAILMTIGVYVKFLSFEIKGLTGLLLGDASVKEYSFLSLGYALPYVVQDPNSFGIKWFQWFYFFFGLIMPCLCWIVSMVLFCIPLKARIQKLLFCVAEVSSASSAMEVFVISIAAALTQISHLPAFAVGNHCDALNKILKMWFDTELDGDDVCLDVKAELKSGAWYLFVGTGLNFLVTFFLLRLVHQSLEERLDREGKIIFGNHVSSREEQPVDGRTFIHCLNMCFCGKILLKDKEVVGLEDSGTVQDEVEMNAHNDSNN